MTALLWLMFLWVLLCVCSLRFLAVHGARCLFCLTVKLLNVALLWFAVTVKTNPQVQKEYAAWRAVCPQKQSRMRERAHSNGNNLGVTREPTSVQISNAYYRHTKKKKKTGCGFISMAALTKSPRHLRAVPRVAETTIGKYWPDVSLNSTDIRSGDVECVCVLFRRWRGGTNNESLVLCLELTCQLVHSPPSHTPPTFVFTMHRSWSITTNSPVNSVPR